MCTRTWHYGDRCRQTARYYPRAFSRIINGKAGISPDMALRLAAWLKSGAESWLRMQATYDLWQVEQKSRPEIHPARNAAAHA